MPHQRDEDGASPVAPPRRRKNLKPLRQDEQQQEQEPEGNSTVVMHGERQCAENYNK